MPPTRGCTCCDLVQRCRCNPESPSAVIGLGSLSWAGHLVHVSIPVDVLLRLGCDPLSLPEGGKTVQLGHLAYRYRSPHVAVAVTFLLAGHLYRTQISIATSLTSLLASHRTTFVNTWHAQLALNLGFLGTVSISDRGRSWSYEAVGTAHIVLAGLCFAASAWHWTYWDLDVFRVYLTGGLTPGGSAAPPAGLIPGWVSDLFGLSGAPTPVTCLGPQGFVASMCLAVSSTSRVARVTHSIPY